MMWPGTVRQGQYGIVWYGMFVWCALCHATINAHVRSKASVNGHIKANK